MSHAYNDTKEEMVTSFRRIHANGEQTAVHIISSGNERYVTVAVDVDPRDFSPVASEAIGYDPTIESAHERATAWMEANPKGVAGENGDSSGGFLKKLFHRINDYGNELQKQNQQNQQDSH